jgi:glycosyltransferase involved in cell wall biosynthesis
MGIGPTIVQAASLTPVKNQGLLLDILALVKQEIPEIRLRVAGDGPLRPVLEAKAKHLGVEKHVQWAGAVLYEEMAAFFQQGHLYLQSSRHESQGMAVLEAMACGLPVLGTRVGVTAELAHLAATDDAAKLAAQVVQTLGNTVEYEALRRRARQCILDHYSLDNTVQRFVTRYEELSRWA